MSRVDHERCRDILDAAADIERYVPELGGKYGDMAYDAVVRKLEVIGEAANRLTSAAKALAPKSASEYSGSGQAVRARRRDMVAIMAI
ncbi:DUF86 domain-containing protein [Rhodococcus sp. NPDC060086]|uniref:HepT-like ribonuclease domain-containing protein n=1 Tax=Rhodococcus sp. NPDC060086 TaxID=3347055 RepID=UPI00365B8A85